MTPDTDRAEIGLHFLDYWRVIRVRLPLIILVFLLAVISAAVIAHYTPRQYASTATIQIKQSDISMTVFGGDNQKGGPGFIATQFQILQQKEMLYPVVDALKLDARWGIPRESAYYKLRGMLDIREIRGTELVQISVLSTAPKEAAEIANAIATEYQRKRISDSQEWVSKSLSQLQEEVEKQRRKVDELAKERDRIRVEEGIHDLSPDTVEDSTPIEGQLLMSVEQQVNSERLRVATLRARQEQLSSMTDEQIMRSAPTLEISDATISQLLPPYQDAASEEARMLSSGYGPNHPNVKSLKAKKDVIFRQLQDQIVVLRKTLTYNLNIAEESLKSLESKLEEARTAQQEAKSKSINYYAVKNNYIQQRKLLEAAEQRLSTQMVEKSMPQSPVTIWEKAEPAGGPSKPQPTLYIIMGAIVGLLCGLGLAFFIEYLDTSVKTMEDVESFLKVPVLAVIPKGITSLAGQLKESADAEAYRILRTNIEFNRKNPEANTVTIVSGGAGEGKSTTMANLATTFAAGGYSTLIVDADLRRPSQHRIFNQSNEVGLSDYLTSDIALEEVVSHTSVENLYLMTAGGFASDAAGILNSQRMMDLIEEVKHRFDIVFFDSPPILGVSDASVLSSSVDLTMIVVQHRRFPRAMLLRVKQAIENVGGTILGVVLNNVDVRHDQHYQYYTSYYNYYYHRPNTPSGKAAKNRLSPEVAEKVNRQSSGADSY